MPLRIGALAATTAADGTFTLKAAATYDVELVSTTASTTSGKQVTVFRGLTTRTPTLEIDAGEPQKTHPSVTVSMQGAGGGAIAGNERVTALFVPAPTTAADSSGRFINSGTSVAGPVSWSGDSPNKGTLYALRYTLDPSDKFITAVAAQGSAPYSLAESGPAVVIPVTMNAVVQTGKLAGTINAAGGTIDTLFVSYRVGGAGGGMGFYDFAYASPTFEVLMPKILGYAGAVMAVVKTASGSTARVWKINLPPDSTGIALDAPADFAATAPAAAAVGVDADTAFTWPAVSGAGYVMQVSCPPVTLQSPLPAYAATIVTAEPTAKVPDTATLGSSLPSGSCEWRVGAAYGAANADAFAGQAGWNRLTVMHDATADGAYVETARRAFTTK